MRLGGGGGNSAIAADTGQGASVLTFSEDHVCSSLRCTAGLGTFTLKKLECSKQAFA